MKERVQALTGVAVARQRLVWEGEEVGELLEEAMRGEEEGEEEEEGEGEERTLWELGLRDRAALTLLAPTTTAAVGAEGECE